MFTDKINFIDDQSDINIFSHIAFVRMFENKLLTLFSEGKLNGTTHTCIGQEINGLVVMSALDLTKDCVLSNHRGHGHFIFYGGSPESLLAEIMGRDGGVCGGLGGSQHLYERNFYSNGIQGGMTPIACGMALAELRKNTDAIVVVFLGDGTLGEGTVYESFNLASVWNLPVLFVIEDNKIAQTTPSKISLAGNIPDRAHAFGIEYDVLNINDISIAISRVKSAVNKVRTQRKPFVFVIDTFRLGPHSKGDDDRPHDEIEKYRSKDMYEILKMRLENEAINIERICEENIKNIVSKVEAQPMARGLSVSNKINNEYSNEYYPLLASDDFSGERQITALNRGLYKLMEIDERVIVFGEDLLDPYGGAFKATRGLSTHFPERVRATPISEAIIAGLANGLAMRGQKPIGEIMFGDFVSLCFDQIINHASKFYFMYNGKVSVPWVLRMPMGGRRGYGPTHSQSLEKHLLGIPGLSVVALSLRHNPIELLRRAVLLDNSPTLFIETKADYGQFIYTESLPGYSYREINFDNIYSVLHLKPDYGKPSVTVVTYGGMLPEIEKAVRELFLEHELLLDVFVLTELTSPPWNLFMSSLKDTHALVTVEEGIEDFGFGSHIIASLAELSKSNFRCKRLGSPNIPIPSSRHLESIHFIDYIKIINTCVELAKAG